MCIAPEKNVFERTLRAFDIVLKPRSAFKWFEQHERTNQALMLLLLLLLFPVQCIPTVPNHTHLEHVQKYM